MYEHKKNSRTKSDSKLFRSRTQPAFIYGIFSWHLGTHLSWLREEDCIYDTCIGYVGEVFIISYPKHEE